MLLSSKLHLYIPRRTLFITSATTTKKVKLDFTLNTAFQLSAITYPSTAAKRNQNQSITLELTAGINPLS